MLLKQLTDVKDVISKTTLRPEFGGVVFVFLLMNSLFSWYEVVGIHCIYEQCTLGVLAAAQSDVPFFFRANIAAGCVFQSIDNIQDIKCPHHTLTKYGLTKMIQSANATCDHDGTCQVEFPGTPGSLQVPRGVFTQGRISCECVVEREHGQCITESGQEHYIPCKTRSSDGTCVGWAFDVKTQERYEVSVHNQESCRLTHTEQIANIIHVIERTGRTWVEHFDTRT